MVRDARKLTRVCDFQTPNRRTISGFALSSLTRLDRLLGLLHLALIVDSDRGRITMLVLEQCVPNGLHDDGENEAESDDGRAVPDQAVQDDRREVAGARLLGPDALEPDADQDRDGRGLHQPLDCEKE